MRRSLRIERQRELAAVRDHFEEDWKHSKRKRHGRKSSHAVRVKPSSTAKRSNKKGKSAATHSYPTPVIAIEPTSFGKTSWKDSKRSTSDTSYVTTSTVQHWIQCVQCLQWVRSTLADGSLAAGEDGKLFAYSNRPFKCGCMVSNDDAKDPVAFLENRAMNDPPRLCLHLKKEFVDAVIAETRQHACE